MTDGPAKKSMSLGEPGDSVRDVEGERYGIVRLQLSDFRNYVREDIAVDPRPVVLTGQNGAGKTNILEALSYLAPGRGLRGATLGEVTRTCEEPSNRGLNRAWAIAATLRTREGDLKLGTGLSQSPASDLTSLAANDVGDRRVVRVDGQAAGGQKVLAEKIRLSWLVPSMDRLFTEAPSGRRRFIDRLTLALDPSHAARTSAYERAMRERNRVLEDDADPRWLGALEEQMAEHGIAIAASRRETVEQLRVSSDSGTGAFPRAALAMSGMVDDWLSEVSATEAEDRFRQSLAKTRRQDGEAGRALFGPHRSDLSVRHVDKDEAAERCSTGEQKALLIGIVLAHARLQALASGATPLMLLDEVTAHLDAKRREALFDEICHAGVQAWLSGTDRSLFEGFGERAQYFEVSEGRLSRAAAI
jgi:DNA replication and repair protein RecF